MNEYRQDLLNDLKDPEYCARYLSAALRDSREGFLVALRDVVEARQGMAKVARDAGVNRENLYRLLSEGGNPRLSSLSSVLEALGLQLLVQTGALPTRNSPRSRKPSAAGRSVSRALRSRRRSG